MTISEFKKLLEKHDWYYFMSDSPTVFDRGFRQLSVILEQCEKNPVFDKLYKEKKESIFNNKNKNS